MGHLVPTILFYIEEKHVLYKLLKTPKNWCFGEEILLSTRLLVTLQKYLFRRSIRCEMFYTDEFCEWCQNFLSACTIQFEEKYKLCALRNDMHVSLFTKIHTKSAYCILVWMDTRALLSAVQLSGKQSARSFQSVNGSQKFINERAQHIVKKLPLDVTLFWLQMHSIVNGDVVTHFLLWRYKSMKKYRLCSTNICKKYDVGFIRLYCHNSE